jgi:protein-S-isoprenylcysteine O-methyltransferase Ste14
MTIPVSTIYMVAFAVVTACWIGFILAFLLRPRPGANVDRKKDTSSISGVVIQAISFFIVFTFRRPRFTSPVHVGQYIDLAIAVAAVVIAVASVLLVVAAVRTLGREWSITARVVEGHKLATAGPYQVTRNPIYTGMLGMLVASGITSSYWFALVVAVPIFLIGTLIRVKSEERLLSETFGDDFLRYRNRVPSLIPGLF